MADRIVIIGAGNMGTAFHCGLANVFADIHLCDRTHKKEACLKKASTVIIAVKPQSFESLMKEVGNALQKKLVISIMAGITVDSLKRMTKSLSVVRSMPNLCAQVGRSITAWIASKQVTHSQRQKIKNIFTSVGKEMELQDEHSMDSFSVIAGCGPAFFFHLYALLEEKAGALGFSAEESTLIARQVFLGSAKLFDESGRGVLPYTPTTPAELVKAVASKGGVTEAALKVLVDKHFDDIFFEAIDAAKKRSTELGS